MRRSSLATWLARDTGIFAKNGLDVELVRTRTTVGVMALLSGELDFIQASGPVVIESNLRGTDLVYVAGGMATLDFIFMSQPEIKSAEMLKGGVVGLASIRGASLVATEFALEKLGLKSRDVKFIVIGGTPERLISLPSKLLQATLLSPPRASSRSERVSILWRMSEPWDCRFFTTALRCRAGLSATIRTR